jgi:hypothetical protein
LIILVYSDSQIIDLEWLPNIDFKHAYKIVHNLEEYEHTFADRKIAFTTHRLHCDFDTVYIGFEDKINHLSRVSNLVFTFESELHDFHWQIWEQCHHDNVYWLLPGAVNDREDINSHIICWSDWFKTTAMLYKQLPQKVAEIQSFAIKPKYFDALLGSPKPHRDFVFNAVNANNLNDKIVMTYGGDWKENEFYAKDYFIWEEGTVPVGNTIGTADWAEYHGQCVHLSQIIPIKTFNETAYSIVAETDFDNTLSFFSEKTAKPIIARRLFVVFSGYKFLHNLKAQGFKTFDHVIDESYDLEFDDAKRYSMAFDQVQQLCSQPQQEIYEKIKDVVEHNYQLLMTRDWTKWPAEKIQKLISTAIDR